ncbi:MAG: UTRA domain-containing protein [Rhizobiaceae bacterium]|nr:UTRA domain-containing protein [Rhizobiaceae bacterium]
MNEPATLYEIVKHHITDGIVAGDYVPGTKLPSESELVERFSVSRMTVNRALRELTRDGVIFRMQGVGSFVSEASPTPSLAEVRDIRDVVAERGGRHSCKVLQAEHVLADKDVSELFQRTDLVPVQRVVLLHYEDNRPLQLETRFVLKDFAPHLFEQDLTEISLYQYLQSVAPLSELEHVVEASLPSKFEQESLELTDGHPILRIRRRTWVGRNVVTLGYFSHPGESYCVSVRVKPSDFRK